MTQMTDQEAIRIYRERIEKERPLKMKIVMPVDEIATLRKWIKRQDKKIINLRKYAKCVEIASNDEESRTPLQTGFSTIEELCDHLEGKLVEPLTVQKMPFV